MKKFLFLFISICLFFCFPHTLLHAEEITSYDVDIDIQKDGTMLVSEKILYDFGTEEKHGFFWSFPLIKTNTEGKKFRLSVEGLTVLNEQKKTETVAETKEGETLKLKIGDPNILVTGKRQYTIHYTVGGALTYFSDHDELFWHSIGSGVVPVQSATVAIHIPDAPDVSSVRLTCYTGEQGSSLSDCTQTYQDGVASLAAKNPLAVGDQFSVVVSFPKNIISVLEPKPVDTWLSRLISTIVIILVILLSIAWYLILPIWIVAHWFRSGRDPKPAMGVASAWFDVPKTDTHRPLTPGETGTLVDEKADMREITATIVDLARRGYLKIVEKKKGDFYLEKKTAMKKADTLEQFEKTLYTGIFSDGDSLRIKDADLVSSVTSTKKQLYDAVVKEKFFVSNPETVRVKYSVLGGVALFTMNIPLSLAAFIFGRAMPKKTVSGAQNAAIGESLKNFITSQDRQYAYQAKNQIFFEKFLPYAIAFGVEKIWADRFKNVGLKKPDWYDGYDMRTFNSVYFVSSLGSSIHSFSSAATPTSSSSGFSSGFSGGGGGGGGSSVGGSW